MEEQNFLGGVVGGGGENFFRGGGGGGRGRRIFLGVGVSEISNFQFQGRWGG